MPYFVASKILGHRAWPVFWPFVNFRTISFIHLMLFCYIHIYWGPSFRQVCSHLLPFYSKTRGVILFFSAYVLSQVLRLHNEASKGSLLPLLYLLERKGAVLAPYKTFDCCRLSCWNLLVCARSSRLVMLDELHFKYRPLPPETGNLLTGPESSDFCGTSASLTITECRISKCSVPQDTWPHPLGFGTFSSELRLFTQLILRKPHMARIMISFSPLHAVWKIGEHEVHKLGNALSMSKPVAVHRLPWVRILERAHQVRSTFQEIQYGPFRFWKLQRQ